MDTVCDGWIDFSSNESSQADMHGIKLPQNFPRFDSYLDLINSFA